MCPSRSGAFPEGDCDSVCWNSSAVIGASWSVRSESEIRGRCVLFMYSVIGANLPKKCGNSAIVINSDAIVGNSCCANIVKVC